MNNDSENEAQRTEDSTEEEKLEEEKPEEEVVEERRPETAGEEHEEPPEELEQITAPEEAPEPRRERYLRLAIRWLAGFLIVFGLGVLATVLLLYRPASEELTRVRNELEQTRQRTTELENRVEQLESLEEENQSLQEELRQANLHIQILSALSSVNAARLDLANEDIANARMDLTNTPDTLDRLEELVGEDQREAVVAMQNRLDLALEEMERDTFAAQSDLRVLATNLVELENIFFASR